jgi:hypothetical protein
MAVRGNDSKEFVKNKILEVFEGSFVNDGGKEIRIPLTENGESLQIRVVLTCPKVNVVPASNTITKTNPKEENADFSKAMNPPHSNINIVHIPTEPTEEEKRLVAEAIAKLNL